MSSGTAAARPWWRLPRFPRTTLVAAAGLAATVAFGVGSLAAGTAFQWQ